LQTEAVKRKELEKKPRALGWKLDRIRGSHHVFVHPQAERSITVPVHGKDIPDFFAKTILKQAQRALKGQDG
jgi:predicted RNA binding protein YcfA (HicA-like mRNA interferase family)